MSGRFPDGRPFGPPIRTMRPSFTSPRRRCDTLPRDMTICIAAIAPLAQAIVAVSDTKLADIEYSYEHATLKFQTLLNYWTMMYAGDPTSFNFFVEFVSSRLRKRGSPKDVGSVIRAIQSAYEAQLEQLINQTVLAHLGVKGREFNKVGLQRYGAQMFAQLTGEMRASSDARWSDGTELLTFGVDAHGAAHLIHTNQIGICKNYTSPGYHAIGSGAELAKASLQFHDDFMRATRLGEVCYRMQAAKFAAENSAFVGPLQTVTTVYHFTGEMSIDYGATTGRVYFDAEKVRSKTIPEDTLRLVEESLGVRTPHCQQS